MQCKTVKKIDKLGRIVLPQEFRKELAWGKETKIAIIKKGSRIILQENNESCFLCGTEENLYQAKDRYICRDCILGIKIKKIKE
ncbi:MAG: AbrB/MazE/SpoVT family DNA-binding domain-containing protein [Bacillota bacterium]|nr:AbrB/MazE/SpoVT family DNA-binding domain-containing protein [Bacillota bacterium]